MDPWIAGAVFVAAFALIASERVDRALAAMAGGLAMIVLGVIDQTEAFGAIDLNVILLLVGTMAIAAVLASTGFFQAAAILVVRRIGSRPIALLVAMAAATAALSSMLPNVTTVVLVAPVSFYVAAMLGVSPVPFLLSQVFAANVGGAATLVGDPPNILVGSAAGIGFTEFFVVMAPVAVLVLVAVLAYLALAMRRDFVGAGDATAALGSLAEGEVITDRRLLRWSVIVLALTVVGFFASGFVGLSPATVALVGATALMLVGRVDPSDALREVDWATIAFFVGLFLLVEGIVVAGIVAAIADWIAVVAGGNQAIATIGILWGSGVVSAMVDNIPYTAAMIPVVDTLGATGLHKEPLWYALALGADFGGNATIVGASANVVAAGLAGRAGHPIDFRGFLRHGVPVTVIALLISTVYLWLRFLV